jgi:hypothetical protein
MFRAYGELNEVEKIADLNEWIKRGLPVVRRPWHVQAVTLS